MLLRRGQTFNLKHQVLRDLSPMEVVTGRVESTLLLSQVLKVGLGVPNRRKSQPLAAAGRARLGKVLGPRLSQHHCQVKARRVGESLTSRVVPAQVTRSP